MDEDEGFEEIETSVPTVRLNAALVVSNGFTLVGNLARAVADFCDTNALLLAAHHNWCAEQRVMHDQATAEIEMLTTQGD